MKLHLGCGPCIIPDFENVDQRVDGPNHDVVKIVDLKEYPWPWADNSCEIIVAQHVLQEFSYRELIPFLKEVKRILKPGGVFRFGVPHTKSGTQVDRLLGWGNVQLFNKAILDDVFELIEFGPIRQLPFKQTASDRPEAVLADNREMETLFIEVYK